MHSHDLLPRVQRSTSPLQAAVAGGATCHSTAARQLVSEVKLAMLQPHRWFSLPLPLSTSAQPSTALLQRNLPVTFLPTGHFTARPTLYLLVKVLITNGASLSCVHSALSCWATV